MAYYGVQSLDASYNNPNFAGQSSGFGNAAAAPSPMGSMAYGAVNNSAPVFSSGSPAVQSQGLPPASLPQNASGVTNTPPVSVPATTAQTPGTNGVSGLVSYYQSQFDTANKAAQDAKAQEDAAQAQQGQTSNSILSLLGQNTTANATATAQGQTGIDPTQYFADEKAQIAQISSLNDQYTSLVQARDQQIAGLTDSGRGQTIDFLNNQAAQIQKNAAPQLNALSSNINSRAAALQASQGMFAEAQNYVQQAVSAATAEAKDKLTALTTLYNMNQNTIDNLDSKYQNALKSATDDANTIYNQQVADQTSVGNLLLQYPKSGIQIGDTPQVASQKAAQWLQAQPNLDDQYKQAQIASLNANIRNTNASTNKINNEIANPGGSSAPTNYNGDFQATVDLVSNSGTTKDQRTQISNTMKTFIANNDYASAYALVSQQTAQSLKGNASTKFSNQVNSLGVLDDLKTGLQALSAAGYDTNKLTGSADQVQTKIGALMTDPKYAAIATQLTQNFQNYRLNMTGAAFGEQESAEYAAVLPSPGNTLSLNLAKIQGASDYLNSSVNATLKSQFGAGAVNIKDKATLPASNVPAAPSGMTQLKGPDGNLYNVPNANVDAFIKGGGVKI